MLLAREIEALGLTCNKDLAGAQLEKDYGGFGLGCFNIY